jgi:flavin reductase (DIM6/NTAB) family NADH-FMN oxidoreductase RutF
MLCISVGPRVDQPPPTKDTLSNIEETGEFVINIVFLPLSNTMHESSRNHPPEAAEFEKAGLTPAPCEVVAAPRVGEAGVSMECLLDRVLPLGTDHLVIGRMIRFHVRHELYENGRIDVAELQPLGRLAGNYTKVETIFELPSEDFYTARERSKKTQRARDLLSLYPSATRSTILPRLWPESSLACASPTSRRSSTWSTSGRIWPRSIRRAISSSCDGSRVRNTP